MLGLSKEVKYQPFAVLIYGVEGIGKTTFGFEAPDPVFMGNENGTGGMEVYKFPTPSQWSEVMRDLKKLETERHELKTLVFDSLDWAENLVFNEVIRREGKGKTIDTSHGGFDRGKVASVAIWKEFLEQCNVLRFKKGMNIIFIAHADAVKFKDPALQTDYQRYSIKLFKQSSALFKEYVDAVLFGNYHSTEDDEGKVTGTAKRYLYTEHRPGWDAKNRFAMPYRIDHRFQDFYKYAAPESIEQIMARIDQTKLKLPAERQAILTDLVLNAKGDRKKVMELERTLNSEVSKLSKEAI